MLKKVLLGGALLAQAAFPALAQRRCATPSVSELPASEQAILQQIESQTERYVAQRAENGTANRVTAATVTIPVVVHVLYNTAAQNISDAIVQSQIDVLNRDFQKLNTDFSRTPTVFQGVAADMQIAFQLATRTPSGAPTNGIIHKYTANSFFDYGRKDPQGVFVKQSAKGGDDAWDTRSYLNIWVCNFGGSASGLLGYATFPSDAGTYKDGVVIGYKYMGVNPSLGGIYGYGRTGTHEVGHYMNLRHIWGDATCGSDLVSDTPTQQTSNYNCPSFPKVTCSNGPNGDMFMNYMDYVQDQCMVMFTNGQKARSQALFAAGGARYSLTTSLGLTTPVSDNVTSALRSATVFPNPTVGASTVQLDLSRTVSNVTVRVIDMQGAPVYETTLRNVAAGVTDCPLPNLPRGMYSVQVLTGTVPQRIRLAVTGAAE